MTLKMRTFKLPSLARVAALGLALSSAAASQALFATISLDDPHKVVSAGAQSIWFSGRIDVLEDNPGPILFVYHAYLEGTNSEKLDVNNYSNAYFNWLGVGGGKHAGDVFVGDLFELVVEDTDPAGLYHHRFGSLTTDSTAYVDYDLDHRSNEASFSVQIVPEPATLVALGMGALALARRRRK